MADCLVASREKCWVEWMEMTKAALTAVQKAWTRAVAKAVH